LHIALCLSRKVSIERCSAAESPTQGASDQNKLRSPTRAARNGKLWIENWLVGARLDLQFDPEPIAGMKQYLDSVSAQWDRALGGLKAFGEK
jgi:hypothetical protein